MNESGDTDIVTTAEEVKINHNFKTKLLYGILLIAGIMILFILVSIPTANISVRGTDKAILIIILLVHFLFLNRIMRGMFSSKCRQYGYYIIIYLILFIIGIANMKRSEAVFSTYIESYVESNDYQNIIHQESDKYLSQHPTSDTVTLLSSKEFIRMAILKSPKVRYLGVAYWFYTLMAYTNSYLATIFFAMFLYKYLVSKFEKRTVASP